MIKEKFLSFYEKTPFYDNSKIAYEAIEKAFLDIPCPCCGSKPVSVHPLVMAYALATIRIECGRDYRPKREIIAEEVANRNYGGRYGNILQGMGYKYRGSGLIQLTFYDNYVRYGKLAGCPEIVENPDLLVTDINVSAKVFVAYFNDKKVIQDCLNKDTFTVRKKINGINSKTGKPNGYDEFVSVIKQFLA